MLQIGVHYCCLEIDRWAVSRDFIHRTHDHDYADINGKFWKPLTDFERAKKGTWMCSLGWVNC